ncbi:thioredoxin family protein [Chryseolinea sp. H1M3-3]|uniref:thioredoxin family protein n=1 Tax=Chryseolinea sp. H1M3-3 TaxID=3034144 RepID=UPI0023ED4420|nr:thioredoxin family protein [Chryseolinea sp. H1M3-3]
MEKIKLLGLVGLILLLVSSKSMKYEIGDAVGDFKLKNVDGKMVALSDYKSEKGVIVIFDCNTCPYSKAYNDRIIALDKKYSEQGFPVIAINANDAQISPGDSYDEMVSRAKKKNYTFPYLIDESQTVARAFGASNTPHVFVLQRIENTFKVAYIGTIDDNSRDASAAKKKYVEDAVEALLNGKPVSTPNTKAIGCTIKWKNT